MQIGPIKLGILLIVAGILIVFLGSFFQSGTMKENKVSIIGFIGPIPIGFSNDKKLLIVSLLLGTIIFLAFLLWRRSL